MCKENRLGVYCTSKYKILQEKQVYNNGLTLLLCFVINKTIIRGWNRSRYARIKEKIKSVYTAAMQFYLLSMHIIDRVISAVVY